VNVSGSNMSGKSTLLRSVGVNVVLALAGAPVTAARIRMSALVLGATLHIEDSLQAGHSRFYAEILRIRTIVDAARGPVPLLFLLDEILHGTNSYDRRIGAEGSCGKPCSSAPSGWSPHDLAPPSCRRRRHGRRQHAFRGSAGGWPEDLRLPDASGVVEHSNVGAHAGDRTQRWLKKILSSVSLGSKVLGFSGSRFDAPGYANVMVDIRSILPTSTATRNQEPNREPEP
jgi:hypothetical protein